MWLPILHGIVCCVACGNIRQSASMDYETTGNRGQQHRPGVIGDPAICWKNQQLVSKIMDPHQSSWT